MPIRGIKDHIAVRPNLISVNIANYIFLVLLCSFSLYETIYFSLINIKLRIDWRANFEPPVTVC